MTSNVRSDRWRDWVMLALGAWLFLSPWILGFTLVTPVEGAEGPAGFTAAAWNAWIFGVVIAALALWAALKFTEWHDWANGVLGVWLVVSPWILGFAALTAALWNHAAEQNRSEPQSRGPPEPISPRRDPPRTTPSEWRPDAS